MAKETVPNRQYTDEFKLEALRLAESVGINQAAKRLGMPSSSLGNWARLKRSGKLGNSAASGSAQGFADGAGGREQSPAPRAGQCQVGSGDPKKLLKGRAPAHEIETLRSRLHCGGRRERPSAFW
jgi:transposase-like protein